MQIIKFLIVNVIFGFQFSCAFIFSQRSSLILSICPFSLSFLINLLNYKNISIDWCLVISLYVVKHIQSVHVFVYLRRVTAHGRIHQ